MRKQTRRREVTSAGQNERVGKLVSEILKRPGCGNTQSPPRRWRTPRPPGRGVRKSPSGRHNHPSPGPCVSPSVRAALGSPGHLHPASPAPSSQPAAWAGSSPQSEPGTEASAVELAPPPAAARAGAGNGWGKGPLEATARHSRVELVVHPLAVATASRSDFRFARSLRLGPGHFRLRGAQRNVGARA